MKYIRTKDGRIVKVGEGTDIGYELGTLEVHNKAEIVAIYEPIEVLREADTIEELCDAFVDEYIKPHNIKLVSENNPYLTSLMKDRKYDNKATNVYGAIWTDKGLIYVARMNSKGELELL